MELALSEDQALFHETTARFIDSELPIERTRALHDDPAGFDRGWWQKAAELGWFTMLVPEADGGGSVSGASLIDATIIAEEIGRNVQPGPFVPANVVASALAAGGSGTVKAEVLPGIVAGETVATWAFAGSDGGWDDGAGVTVTTAGDGYRLDGRRGFVQDAPSSDVLLVVGQLDGQPVQLLVPADAQGVTQTVLTTLDLSRRMAHVDLAGVTVGADALVGSPGCADAVEHQLQIAVVLNCAETVGAMDALFTMTVEYAKDRIAFGRPIGSYQSLKHILADEALNLESCKATAVAVARAVNERSDDAAEVVSMVAAHVGDLSHQLAQMCLQVHGGIGYTWEHDLHLLMRRIKSNAALFGVPTWHRERVCAFHGLGEGSRS